ncbi:putative PAS/PAC sensor protein [Candidatus Moduliflexus flocculans]|uniref:Putative PAS/PAC sensor protein n=1 Tax=Candidatus Moduliflexus flocculans TaxID=1499966 RepID=A0A0S6VRM6_9BACT|nr:putative PAS/PAC sensor protein [Candidatus Moduliflexus flocculans]
MLSFFRRLSIQWKLAFSFMALSLFPLFGLGSMAYFTSQATIRQKVGFYSQKNLEQICQNLQGTLEQIEKLSRLIVLDGKMSERLATFSTQTTLQKLKRTRDIEAELSALAISHPDVRQILLARRHEPLLASKESLLEKEQNYFSTDDFWQSDLYQEIARLRGQVIWKSGIRGKYTEFYLLRQLIDPNTAQELGILVFVIKPDLLNRVLIQQTQSDGSQMFVIEQSAKIVAHSQASLTGTSVTQTYLPEIFRDSHAGYFQTETALVVFSPLSNQWHIIWEIPLTFLFEEINRVGMIIVLAVVVCGALAVALGLAISSVYSRIIRELVDSASAIANGELDHPLQLSGEDEIGQLAKQFATMRDAIRQKIEALQTLNSELDMRVEQRTLELSAANAELARGQYILNCFMDNVPDGIYFKDRDSRFFRLNNSFAAKFGVNDPALLIGKCDFDFFSEEYARPKYEQEQEIIRTGQPLLAFEEPDFNGRWALSTKMPLRDEYGEIVGTFGISRDITPLKTAQKQIEDAYAEIQILNEQLKQENLRMSAELDVARRLQMMVLPKPQELTQIPDLDIVGYMQPADEVGGDYYDVLHCQQGRVCIGIGDVTGHGLESGVLMLMTQTAIRTLIDRGEIDPVIFLGTLNRVLYQNIQRMGGDRSLTLSMVSYQNGQIRIIGQHEEAIVVRQNGQIERLDTIDLGFPLGMVADIREWVTEVNVTLQSGDGVVLYTDGITEAQNAHNQFYGLERLCAVISANWRGASAETVKEAIIADVRAFIGNAIVYDDVTLVVLKQTA